MHFILKLFLIIDKLNMLKECKNARMGINTKQLT